MVGWQLFLPASWTDDATSMTQADGPGGDRTFRTNPESALPKLDRVTNAGTPRFGLVLTDAGQGYSAAFRAGWAWCARARLGCGRVVDRFNVSGRRGTAACQVETRASHS